MSRNGLEVIETIPNSESNFIPEENFSMESVSQYRETVLELRKAFNFYGPGILQNIFFREKFVDLLKLSPKSLEFVMYRIQNNNAQNLGAWALNSDNWFLVNSDKEALELQKLVSLEFPVLIFDNLSVEYFGNTNVGIDLPNFEEIVHSTGIHELWKRGHLGSNYEIVVIDTGVSDFCAKKNNIERTSVLNFNPCDFDGHGSSIAETILAVSPQAKISSKKAVELKRKDMFNIGSALTSLYSKYNTIVNISIGINPTDFKNKKINGLALKETVIHAAYSGANNNNLFIAAGGNYSKPELIWPAAANNILAVGSHNKEFELSSFSNYSYSANFILSPGGDKNKFTQKIESLGKYESTEIYGTSFSTAIVSGVCSLLMDYRWFREMSVSSKIALFNNICRKNKSGFPILNISDLGAVWPLD
ncbi:MAG: S8/S53 family peptidase [Ignavibacteria bacterium]|nr:S8/S53 family peptidase [Ignavibacteria bacterium]